MKKLYELCMFRLFSCLNQQEHGWPSTQAEVKTEAEAHLAEVSLAES